MNSLYDEDEVETKARAATTCPACGDELDYTERRLENEAAQGRIPLGVLYA